MVRNSMIQFMTKQKVSHIRVVWSPPTAMPSMQPPALSGSPVTNEIDPPAMNNPSKCLHFLVIETVLLSFACYFRCNVGSLLCRSNKAIGRDPMKVSSVFPWNGRNWRNEWQSRHAFCTHTHTMNFLLEKQLSCYMYWIGYQEVDRLWNLLILRVHPISCHLLQTERTLQCCFASGCGWRTRCIG